MARDSPEMLNYILNRYVYDPVTGKFYNSRGKEIGCYTKEYPEISIRGKTFRLHQLAYIIMMRTYPPKGYEIDHQDRDPHNNRWDNLRVVTKGVNIYNQRRSEKHGVYFETSTRKWVAQLRVDLHTYKRRFSTLEEAIAFREELELKHRQGI